MFAARFVPPTDAESDSRKRRRGSGLSDSKSEGESGSEASESSSEESLSDSEDEHSEDEHSDVEMEDAASSESSVEQEADSSSEEELTPEELKKMRLVVPKKAVASVTAPPAEVPAETPAEPLPEDLSKHSKVFAKFKKSAKADIEETTQETNVLDEVPAEVQDGLVPLPQPDLPRDKRLVSQAAHLKNLDWLATPTYASPEITTPFGEFGLSSWMMDNLAAAGFTSAFSVQNSVLNILLGDIRKNKLNPDFQGDVLVNASTGSGKTLAYTIPILEALAPRVVPRVRAIILVPTKPLISQVRAQMAALAKGTPLKIMTLKTDVSIKEEAAKLSNNPDIVISTPGRLVEHIQNELVDLGHLRFVVIDEADRLLNQLFQNWCQVLIGELEKNERPHAWHLKPQKLIFSATLTTDAGKLSLLKFHKPRLVIVNLSEQLVNEIFSVPSTLSEYSLSFGSAKNELKPLILAKYLIQHHKLANVLVFTKSNESCLRLARLLQMLLSALGHGLVVQHINSTNNSSSVRQKILKDFSQQQVHVVVATDLIARGIDVASITDVFNYDLPNSAREYVHRVGRTARANQPGNAYTLCFGKGETKWFGKIMRDVGRGAKVVEPVAVDLGDLISPDDRKRYQDVLG